MSRRAWAPGRVNLIGDHTDYTGGVALPLAIGLGVEIRGDSGADWVILGSEGNDGIAEMPLVVHHPERVEPPWARYVAGVVAEMQPREGLIGTIRSTLPSGVGLASSAALEVAVAVALGADLADPIGVAEMCQRAEHRAVGVPCGIMDQFCIVAAVEDAVLLLDCGTLESDAVPMPDGVDVAIIDSRQPRQLAASPYARRRAECAQVESLIGPLRTATLEDIDVIDDPVLWRRARHVITENQRVDATALALEDGDLMQAGDLMVASHLSLRDDYEVSTPRLDAVVDHLRSTPGVFGARLTGAGFGGCVVALCTPDAGLDLPVVWRGRPAPGATID
jgi:galactokinase